MSIKADFRAYRESLGISQGDVAEALKINMATEKHWEAPKSDLEPPAFAWDYLDDLEEQREYVVETMVEASKKFAEQSGTNKTFVLYFRTNEQWRRVGNGQYPMGFANMCAREAANILIEKGYDVGYEYPEDRQ